LPRPSRLWWRAAGIVCTNQVTATRHRSPRISACLVEREGPLVVLSLSSTYMHHEEVLARVARGRSWIAGKPGMRPNAIPPSTSTAG